MSVTVSDIMKLPSLSEARLIAGEAGLSKMVSSITVLEYADASMLAEELFNNNEFYGSEIVITGFINIKDNIEAQCAAIQRLHEVGEVGIILYYVGIFLPKIDDQVINLANELGFPLICMPENRINMRYSEVICEVMEIIFKDQLTETYFVSEILERISLLPNHQRSMDSVLKMLSDRMRCSLFLTDDVFNVLNIATWPRTSNLDVKSVINHYNSKAVDVDEKPTKMLLGDKLVWINCLPVANENAPNMYLIIIKENTEISYDACKQANEVVQLFVNIWSPSHSNIGSAELVRAILNDEPVKMRRLAEILQIDVASIHTMFVIKSKNEIKKDKELEDFNRQVLLCTKKFFDDNCENTVTDIYEDSIVAFMNNPTLNEYRNSLAEMLMDELKKENLDIALVLCLNLETTFDVRNAYITICEYLASARVIYPDKDIITLQEVQFAGVCQSVIMQGENAVNQKLSVLKPLESEDKKQELELHYTLAVFLLDAHSNIAETAQKLYLHKNTIKYRIHRINERVNYNVMKMPESYNLYFAVAIERLLANSNKV